MEPLLLHHHLAKNAGSSLRQVIRANYASGELREWYRMSPWADGLVLWREWYESLDDVARTRLRCVGSHSAQRLFEVVDDRPVEALTVLRDPVDRVRSLYNHALWQEGRRRAAGVPIHGERLANQIKARGWTLKDIYRELGGRDPSEVPIEFLFFFNGQARELLANSGTAQAAPLSTGAGLDDHRRMALETLSDRYVVGTQDHFSQSVRLFAERFRWPRVFLPRINVAARDRGSVEMDAETRELAGAYNSLDTELHERYSDRLSALPPVSGLSQARWGARRKVAGAVEKARRRLPSRGVAGHR